MDVQSGPRLAVNDGAYLDGCSVINTMTVVGNRDAAQCSTMLHHGDYGHVDIAAPQCIAAAC